MRIYQAETTLPAFASKSLLAYNATIANGSVVLFTSDTGISLEPEFAVDLGGEFDAVIQACPVNFKVVMPGNY